MSANADALATSVDYLSDRYNQACVQRAVLTGRVYQQPLLPRGPSHEHLLGRELTDPAFQQYVRPLSEQQWMDFQTHEKIYRDRLNTNRQREKNFVSSGDPGKWKTLTALLNGVFFKNGGFTAEGHSGKPFGLQLLKYVARVLKKFPLAQPYPEVLTAASTAD